MGRKKIPDKKICSKCGEEKNKSEFNINRTKGILKNGELIIWESLFHMCKKCHSEVNKINKNNRRSETLKYHSIYNKMYREKYRQKLLARGKKYREMKKHNQ